MFLKDAAIVQCLVLQGDIFQKCTAVGFTSDFQVHRLRPSGKDTNDEVEASAEYT